MKREYYSDTIASFLITHPNSIIGQLARNSEFDVGQSQLDAWLVEIDILQRLLVRRRGHIYFEYSIPRMGKRVDVVLIVGPVVFVLEFKVGEKKFHMHAVDQVFDYSLDLKNFHETSHDHLIAPILIATKATSGSVTIRSTPHNDKLLFPLRCTPDSIGDAIDEVLRIAKDEDLDPKVWEDGRYSPTPTIIEAATALYRQHRVEEISRKDADAINLSDTSEAISEVIRHSSTIGQKSICFVTGVPGAGKTLVGLDIATKHLDKSSGLHSIFLSGNGPLVSILREALARDKVQQAKAQRLKIKKKEAASEVSMFVQNVHHYRDAYLVDSRPPVDHIALFDEAQRAWNVNKTSGFMRRRRNNSNFHKSEPEFLISCLDRHSDWAVIVCLVGGGQEIHTGEAGIGEWINSLNRSFPDWHIYVSPRLTDSEYGAGVVLKQLTSRANVTYKEKLHLSVSMRSFRAENVSLLVKQLLDLDVNAAKETLATVDGRYPIVLTRDVAKAKSWLRKQARGSERYGIVASSQAERLKPHAIDVKCPTDPIHWFLNEKDDVRSSYYLEDVATEFHVQGLELDWVCVAWDADLRFSKDNWQHWSFVGSKWNRIHKPERQSYQKNAYRVLLTRARQGMVVVVPHGDDGDATRKRQYYDPTYEYLRQVGLEVI